MRALLLDIEGTTTPGAFVYEVLFPYARTHLEEFLRQHHASPAVQSDLADLRTECARDAAQKLALPAWREDSPEAALDSAVRYLRWLMEQDRKATPLKSLQGKIWEAGYRSGTLRSQVYPDVPPALDRWQRQQRAVAIFSSGSILAQKLLFAHTSAGDLTGFIRAYFDTTTGPKQEPHSYHRIATALGLRPEQILFVSDVMGELDAARAAGLATALCVRQQALPAGARHPVIRTFDELLP